MIMPIICKKEKLETKKEAHEKNNNNKLRICSGRSSIFIF